MKKMGLFQRTQKILKLAAKYKEGDVKNFKPYIVSDPSD